MKLFSRSKIDANDTTPAPATANAGTTVIPVPAQAAGGAPVIDSTKAGAPPEAVEFAAALDSSVKEMSEKIARLTSSVESVHDERQSFEEKIARMEERMRKLSALTEMISNQYNPFIGEEPTEGAELEAPAPASAKPLPAAAPIAMPQLDAVPAPAPAPAHAAPVEAGPMAPAMPEAPPLDLPEAPAPEPEPPTPAPAPAPVAAPAPQPLPEPVKAPAPSAPAPLPLPPLPVSMMTPQATGQRAHLERIEPTFENHLVALNWANLLLKNTSPFGLMDLLGYYESLGWISRDVKRQLLTYAEGIAWTDNGQSPDSWRGNLDLHQRSLLFIERLKGLQVDEENYRSLRRDITRIAGEERRA